MRKSCSKKKSLAKDSSKARLTHCSSVFSGVPLSVRKTCRRGDRLTVACRMQGTRFETESGEIRYGVQLVGEQIYFAAVTEVT